MSYLGPPFQHDIFLSYAWVNNRKRANEQSGWVDDFQEDLIIELAQHIGRTDRLKVWRDKRNLDGNQKVDEEIQNRINASALFLCLTSNAYLNPESYCLKELAWFYKRANADGYKLGTRVRIFNVLLNNVKNWPKEISGSGYTFHDGTEEGDFGNTLRRSDPGYTEQVRRLAKGIFETLKAFNEVLPKTLAEPGEATHKYESVTVFLAHTADTLTYDIRERVLNDLRQSGARVITDVPPPHPAADHDQVLEAATSQAQLSVHLFDENPGGKVEGLPNEFYPQRQAELVLQKPIPQFIWVPQTLGIDTIRHEKHKEFLSQLENGKRAKTNYRFVRESAASVTREVFATLDEILKPPPPPGGSAGRTVLVDTHPKDQVYAFKLSDSLLKSKVLITSSVDDPGKNVEGFEDILRQVSLLIIIFGHVAEEWVVGRIKEAFKVAGASELRSLKACGVYLPRREDGDQKRQLNVGLLPDSIRIFLFNDPQGLDPLLEYLASSPT